MPISDQFPTQNQSGYAIVMVVVMMAVSVIIISGITSLSVILAQDRVIDDQSTQVVFIAESAAKEAVLKLLRDPEYQGEQLSIEGGSAFVNVSGTTQKVITIRAEYQKFERELVLLGSFENQLFTLLDWQER